jgi:hypothetical protein
MRRVNTALVLAVAAAASLLPAATPRAATPAEAAPLVRPARIEPIEGTNLRKITLTDRAAQRLDVQTSEILQDPSGEQIVPYAAVLYDLAGVAWIYTNPEPRTFVRHRVSVARINGTSAYLKEGPPVGTRVVTVGVSQLYGAEKGVGH